MTKIRSYILKFINNTPKWDRRSFLGLILAFIASITMTTVFIANDYRSRLGLAILVAGVVVYALPARFRVGQCPNCGLAPKKQLKILLEETSKQSSLTQEKDGEIIISQGWDINFLYQIDCPKCNSSRKETKIYFIGKEDASTSQQALILGRNKEEGLLNY